MRRLAAFAALCLSTACASLRVAPGATAVTGIDFTPYTKQGFFFSPVMFTGSYEPIGLVTVTTVPDAYEDHNELGYKVWRVRPVLVRDVVDTMYRRARAMGADALVNFSNPHNFGATRPPVNARRSGAERLCDSPLIRPMTGVKE